MWDDEDLTIAVGDVQRIKAAVSAVLAKAKKEADDEKAELAEVLRARMVAAKEKRAEKADKKANKKARKEVAASDAKPHDEGLIVWVYEGDRMESRGEQRAHVGATLTDDVFGACELRGQREGSLLLRVNGEVLQRTAGHVTSALEAAASEAGAAGPVVPGARSPPPPAPSSNNTPQYITIH